MSIMNELSDVIVAGLLLLFFGGLVIAAFAGIEKLGEWIAGSDRDG